MDRNKYRYNNAVKRILSNKAILSVIFKALVSEYKDASKEDIRDKYIQGNVRDNIGSGKSREVLLSSGSGVEQGAVTYDIRFDALLPNSSKKHSKILINLEAQKNTKGLSYKPATRGIYYASNMIASEYGTVFSHSHYEKIEKVYSIWICMTPSAQQAGSLNIYDINERQISKCESLNKEDYDKLAVIVYHIGEFEEGIAADYNIREMADLITHALGKDNSPDEVKDYLRTRHNIEIDKELEEDIDTMCNWADVIEERGLIKGREEGIEQNKIENTIRLIANGKLSLEDIASCVGLPIEKVQELATKKTA